MPCQLWHFWRKLANAKKKNTDKKLDASNNQPSDKLSRYTMADEGSGSESASSRKNFDQHKTQTFLSKNIKTFGLNNTGFDHCGENFALKQQIELSNKFENLNNLFDKSFERNESSTTSAFFSNTTERLFSNGSELNFR